VLRKGHATTLTDRLGGKDLDEVGTRLFLFAYVGADFVRRASLFASPLQRLDSGQNARAGKHSFGDGVAERKVRWGPNALHGREAGHQREPGVGRGVVGVVLGRAARASALAVLSKTPSDVDVGV